MKFSHATEGDLGVILLYHGFKYSKMMVVQTSEVNAKLAPVNLGLSNVVS
jgi:hypothetical protein